jgi:predicted membrane-bound dolichyl-phosphate-mannose-protein mannosyltransferase
MWWQLLVAPPILFLYARTFFDRAAAFRAVAYLVLEGNVLALLMDPWLVDGPALFVSIVSFYLVRRDRLLWATATLCLGVTVHESLLLVVFTLLVAHMADNRWRFDLSLIPLVGLPVFVYALIHYSSLVYGSMLTYEFWSAANRQAVTRRHLDGSLDKSLFLPLRRRSVPCGYWL